MKVLFAIGRMSVGGAERLLVRQLSTLDRKRFEPRLVTIFAEQSDTLIGQVHIDRCFNFRSTFDVPALWHLYRYIRKEHFDAVVTSLFTANLVVRIAAVAARVPVIISYEHNIYPDKRRWQIFMDRLLARFTRVIITDSEAGSSFTSRQERIPREKFKTMYIPPLLEHRSPTDAKTLRREIGIPEGSRVVLTVSRLVSDKGHTYLIDAAKRVLAKHPDVVFVLVGWGPLKDALISQASEAGIENSVRLPGRLDIQDVLPLADVYVDPSVSTDLPVAIMEAMREGKAIVATEVGDVPVFVENGVTGLCVPPRDVSALAVAIETMLSDHDLAAKLGAAARARVARYSLQEYMREFEDLVLSFHGANSKR